LRQPTGGDFHAGAIEGLIYRGGTINQTSRSASSLQTRRCSCSALDRLKDRRLAREFAPDIIATAVQTQRAPTTVCLLDGRSRFRVFSMRSCRFSLRKPLHITFRNNACASSRLATRFGFLFEIRYVSLFPNKPARLRQRAQRGEI
jgi:hypothetical protein